MRIGRREVALTNQEKVFFPGPGLTKGDLVSYYLDLAPCALNHVERRPMQMKRYPHGVEGEFFYQKRVPTPHPDWLETVHVLFPGSGRTADFPVVTDAAGLAWIVNLGCIELHTWHARVDDVERPDYLLIDLDPSEGNPWELVPEIALVVKEVMDELGLASFPKTSGATGFHILAPIKPRAALPGGAPVREGARAGGRAPDRRPGRGHDDLEGRRPQRRLRRLRPERPRPHDRLGVLDPPDSGRARLGAASLGRGPRRRPGRLHAGDDARRASPRWATSPRGCGDERSAWLAASTSSA